MVFRAGVRPRLLDRFKAAHAEPTTDAAEQPGSEEGV